MATTSRTRVATIRSLDASKSPKSEWMTKWFMKPSLVTRSSRRWLGPVRTSAGRRSLAEKTGGSSNPPSIADAKPVISTATSQHAANATVLFVFVVIMPPRSEGDLSEQDRAAVLPAQRTVEAVLLDVDVD